MPTRFKQKLNRGVYPGEWQLVCRGDPLPTYVVRRWFVLHNRLPYFSFYLLSLVLFSQELIYCVPLL